MKKIAVRDTAVVLVLTKEEAKALKGRLDLHTGVIESKAAKRVKQKLAEAMGEI